MKKLFHSDFRRVRQARSLVCTIFSLTLLGLDGAPAGAATLVGHWEFEEGSGTSAADSSGNGNTGTLQNGPTWKTGKIGGGLSFNGDDDVRVYDSVLNAGEIEANEQVSFTYNITDANGSSNTATVTVTVQDGDSPPSDVEHMVNFFPASSSDTVVVDNMNDLVTAVNNAPPGRHILIAAGTYTGGTRTFTGAGTEANPIVIRPEGSRGSVTINSPTWTLASGSERVVLTNLYFNNAQFNINGQNIRISRCRFRQVNRNCISWSSLNLRVDHNDVSDYVDSSNSKRFLQPSASGVVAGTTKGLLFDHNYFHDLAAHGGSDGIIQVSGSVWETNPNIIVDRLLLRNSNMNNRWISNKWSGSIIRYCTFENISGAYLQQRLGGGWEIRSNWFEGVGSISLRCFDDKGAGQPPQLVIGNRFIGSTGVWVGAGDTDQPGPQGGGAYHASFNGRFIGNVFGTGLFHVGAMWSAYTATVRATDNVFEANTRNGAPMSTSNGINLLFETGTTISSTTDEPYTAAVKLTPSDVGMAAPDPFCPNGPQS